MRMEVNIKMDLLQQAKPSCWATCWLRTTSARRVPAVDTNSSNRVCVGWGPERDPIGRPPRDSAPALESDNFRIAMR